VDAIYARQSIDKKDSLSIESQIQLCGKYAGENPRVFRDKGFSGKNTRRPAFTELIQAVEAGEIQKIFVYRLDRFSRSIADFSRLWELMERHGVEFHSVTEQFDTASPMGRAMLNIILVFAQLERETTAQRVRDNYFHRFSLGAWPGGPAPYGFDLAKCTQDGRRVSTLSPNDRSAAVGEIFRAYARPEASLSSVARELSARGIPGPRRETWDNVSLSRLLRNPVYVMADREVYCHYLARGIQIRQGPEAFDGAHACHILGRRSKSGGVLTVANHRGFVPASLWLEVQEKLSGNRPLPRESAGRASWLTGLLKCAKCGYAVKLNRGGDGRLYPVCSGRANLSRCDARLHTELPELEAAVAAALDALPVPTGPDLSPAAPADARTALALQDQIDRLVEALSHCGAVSADYISRRIEQLHRQRETLLAQASGTAPEEDLRFSALSFAEKKLAAGVFIDRIALSDDRAEIFWKY